MAPHLIKTNEDGLLRDMNSKALLNTDRSALESNRNQRSAHLRREVELRDLRSAYNHLERRLEELTTIVTQANSFIKT